MSEHATSSPRMTERKPARLGTGIAESNEQRLLSSLQSYWGYDQFRPHQLEAMSAAMEGRDSVVVLPTGGGKSLCYQAPATCLPGIALVISPLISLMKDQVDALQSIGIAADFLNSSQSPQARGDVFRRLESGDLKLLYLAPERLVTDEMMACLQRLPVSMVAVDEAHCISAWGHDFRPEYRRIGELKQSFPKLSVHAYTATATEKVRADIVDQLHLQDPLIFVGSFDRPNLSYRLERRTERLKQIAGVIDQHKDESGIVYCLSRADTETIAQSLRQKGYAARAYHAGLSDDQRRTIQDDFIHDRVSTIVATIAFGMGIDKPNVRYVIHAAMPKSIENYQQETGRAGRDGLESSCVLFYSGHDFHVWKRIMEQSEEAESGILALQAMYQFCQSVRCRHQSLLEYFGQTMPDGCREACDVCSGHLQTVDDGLIIAQKIISCVARTGQRYGGEYVSLVLIGSKDQKIAQRGHQELSTFGLMKEYEKKTIRDWLEQLVEQDCLEKVGEYNVIVITELGRQVPRGQHTPRILQPKPTRSKHKATRDKEGNASGAGVDRGLFEHLRELRRELSTEQGTPAYLVFGDQTLRDMARKRPSNSTKMLEVKGVGMHKLEAYGEVFTACINGYCREHGIDQDVRA